MPGERSDRFMSHIRQGLEGDPSHDVSSLMRDGLQPSVERKVFDLGKWLVACLIKGEWEDDSH